MALEQFFDQAIEPRALCCNCEYFDGGGLRPDGIPFEYHGDCLNPASGHFTTTQDDWCKKFFPCSTRWPDADHG